MPTREGLTNREIEKLVFRYIGVQGGYLGDFSYRTHPEFYLDLELDIDPNQYEGTTRQRFMTILSGSPPHIQACILEGILERYPIASADIRTPERFAEINSWVAELRGASPVRTPEPRITSEVVSRALADAETLLQASGATSGVDRAHTALHGYLRAVSREAGLQLDEDADLTRVFGALRSQHPAFKSLGPRSEDITRVIRSLANIVDALNPVRNRASVAHPNERLLSEPEAMLVVNAIRTLLRYVDDRIAHHK